MTARVVLVGPGHAHLFALRYARAYAAHGIELLLVGPGTLWYSGLATGVLGGMYPPGLDAIDAAALARLGGARHSEARVRAIDPGARTLRLEDGRAIEYDVASFAIGSVVAPLPRSDDAPPCFPVKPIERLVALRRELERRFEAGEEPRVLVAGGGPSGCEIAANIAALAKRRGARAHIVLIGAAGRLLPRVSQRAAGRVVRHLGRSAGVRVRTGVRVAQLVPGGALLDDGSLAGADLVVAATGVKAPPLFGEAGLGTASDGALLVDSTLRARTDARLFAAGDCAAPRGPALARIGVYAIRQAPVLHHNLLAAVLGGPLRAFRPQRRFLLILNLGDGRALATRGRLHWYGRSAMLLKDRIDRRFLERHRLS